MTFTFTDYTYSGLLSILASLYGVGYPLIIQSISSIYSQYDSSRLANRFTSETIYKVFQTILVINLVVAVTIPFLLHIGNNIQLLLTVQTICIIFLLTASFMLFRLIVTYSNADKLFKHLSKGAITNHNLEPIFDLAVHADRKRNPNLYYEALATVFTYFYHQQDLQKQEDPSGAVVYDEASLRVLETIRNYIRTEGQNNYLHTRNDVISILYNQISETRISMSTHHAVWRMLCDAVANDNRTWFSQYWQYADSYDHLIYHFPRHNDPRQLDKDTFRLRHVMLGAMLFHHERYSYLNDIILYTHSQPEYFGLIPSTFAEIVSSFEKMDKLCTIPYFQQQAFFFSDQMGGIKDESFMLREAFRYYALLFIRLWSLQDHLTIGHSVFAVPAPPALIADDERDIAILRIIQSEIESWYHKDVFTLIPRLSKVDKDKVLSLITLYIAKCQDATERKQTTPDVSPQKLQHLKDRSTTISQSFTLQTPSANPSIDALESKGEYSSNVFTYETIKTIEHSDYKEMDATAVIDTLWANFGFKINECYTNFINRQYKLHSFFVHDSRVPELLSQLGLTDKYAVIALGGNGYIKDFNPQIKVYNLSGYLPNRIFFIAKKEQLPYLTLVPIDEALPSDMLEVETYPNVYTNLERFRDCHQPNYDLCIATRIQIHSSAKSIGVVEVEVDHSYMPTPPELTEVTTLDEMYNEIEK